MAIHVYSGPAFAIVLSLAVGSEGIQDRNSIFIQLTIVSLVCHQSRQETSTILFKHRILTQLNFHNLLWIDAKRAHALNLICLESQK
jgi:hypothetical protein